VSVKVKLNRRGVAELLRSTAVGQDLSERGRRIAAAAGDGFTVTRQVTKSRQRVSIITDTTESRIAEATDRVLTRSLDAGR